MRKIRNIYSQIIFFALLPYGHVEGSVNFVVGLQKTLPEELISYSNRLRSIVVCWKGKNLNTISFAMLENIVKGCWKWLSFSLKKLLALIC